jgi:flagellar M-ring protein FliF
MNLSNFSELGTQLPEVWRGLGRMKQMVIVGVGLLCVISVVVMLSWAKTPDYATLFSNLSTDDAAAITASLDESKTPYELASGGTAIKVPSEIVYKTRLDLASAGLPQGGGVGFEIFDKTNFGMTDFLEQVNYQRALEGELGRTIDELSPVEQSRVHIVIPQDSLYTDQKKETTASVLLKLKPGQQLKDDQVRGISQLVSSSVEGLKPENLSIIDSNGRVLSDAVAGSSDSGQATSGQLEAQTAFETNLEGRIQGMLDKVLGTGMSTVQVKTDINWDKIDSTTQTYSPNDLQPQVRSSQVVTETYNELPPEAGGVPGTQSNLPTYQGVITSSSSNMGAYQKSDSTTNYELSNSVETISKAPGGIKKMSVAVVVDSGKNASSSQIADITKLVSAAAGVDTTRGDVIAVSSLPFNRDSIEADLKSMQDAAQFDKYMSLGKVGAMALGPVLLLVLLFMLTRRGKSKQMRGGKQLKGGGKRPQLAGPAAAGALGGNVDITMSAIAQAEEKPPPSFPKPIQEDPQHKFIREQVTNLAKMQPEAVADMIKSWQHEDGR